MTPVLKQQPVSQGSAAYHGYWGLDFTTVDPHLGTDQDFADLVNAAHGLGMKVYLDVVVNHTADVVQLDRHLVHRHPLSRLPRQDVQPGALRDEDDVPVPEGREHAARPVRPAGRPPSRRSRTG